MTRIRAIKPQLFRHADLFDAEKATQLPLRLAFIGLILCCDKEGRFHWRPRELKLDVLPYDDNIDFAKVLDLLVQYQFVVKYTVDNISYGYIPSWHKHQVINPREHRSLIPAYIPESNVVINFPQSEEKKPVTAISENSFVTPLNTVAANTASLVSPTLPPVEPLAVTITPPLINPKSKLMNTITEIFDYWKQVMDHPQAKLDKKREKLIQHALAQGYSKDELCMAIQGCKLTPYHMGNNEQGQRYDSLKVILRDADQIDRFLRNYHSPPKPLNSSQRRSEANRKVLQEWLHKSQAEMTSIN